MQSRWQRIVVVGQCRVSCLVATWDARYALVRVVSYVFCGVSARIATLGPRVARYDVVGLMREGFGTSDEETTSRGVHRTFRRAACAVCCFRFGRVFLVGRVMADVLVVGLGYFFWPSQAWWLPLYERRAWYDWCFEPKECAGCDCSSRCWAWSVCEEERNVSWRSTQALWGLASVLGRSK